MKILSIQQIRDGDKFTIENEPISSINLMERAATNTFNYLIKKYTNINDYCVICGIGNNGGDGFVIARLLLQKKYNVKVFWIKFFDNVSNDCLINYKRLNDIDNDIITIIDKEDSQLYLKNIFCNEKTNYIIIDAIFGSGLNRPLDNKYKKIIDEINNSKSTVVSIDIPSGLYSDFSTVSSENNDMPIIQADETITFQFPKLSFLFPENYPYVGEFSILNIGISETYIANAKTNSYLIDNELYNSLKKCRSKFDHKGKFGHAMFIAGDVDKFGATIMAAKSCMKSGVGLLTVDIPTSCNNSMNIVLPQAMINSFENSINNNVVYQSIGIGPGIGTSDEALKKLKLVLQKCNDYEKSGKQIKLVIDADGINLLSLHKELLDLLPSQTILTPHPKEFARLFGAYSTDYERIGIQKKMSTEYNIIIIYKTAHTLITLPDGRVYFNFSGNPGMATAGSGDVLTGLITGLLARGYTPEEAAIIGVYSHGIAGDKAADKLGVESMNALDIIDYIKL